MSISLLSFLHHYSVLAAWELDSCIRFVPLSRSFVFGLLFPVHMLKFAVAGWTAGLICYFDICRLIYSTLVLKFCWFCVLVFKIYICWNISFSYWLPSYSSGACMECILCLLVSLSLQRCEFYPPLKSRDWNHFYSVCRSFSLKFLCVCVRGIVTLSCFL